MRVRRLARSADDGYQNRLVPGLRSSVDAEHLAEELAFASTRLEALEQDPPGLYAEVAAAEGELEERTWLAFLIAYISPLDGDDPFASIAAGEVVVGVGRAARARRDRARASHGARSRLAARRRSTPTARGPPAPARRRRPSPARAHGRPSGVSRGCSSGSRYRAFTATRASTCSSRSVASASTSCARGALQFGGDNEVTIAAKRALGIGDTMLLERRAAELAGACGLPLEALDLGLYNWERGADRRSGWAPTPSRTRRARGAGRTRPVGSPTAAGTMLSRGRRPSPGGSGCSQRRMRRVAHRLPLFTRPRRHGRQQLQHARGAARRHRMRRRRRRSSPCGRGSLHPP